MKENPLSKHRRAGTRRRAEPSEPAVPAADERSRTGAQPRSTPGRGEIVGYGLLATAVAAGVLYLDGQRARDIAIIAVAILALLVTLVLIAPRLGEPDKRHVAPHVGHDRPPARARGTRAPGRVSAAASPEPEPRHEPTRFAEPDVSAPDSITDTAAGTAKPGRRAKRGRRRR